MLTVAKVGRDFVKHFRIRRLSRCLVDSSVENESPPSSRPRVPNRQLRTASSSAGTRRAEPGVRVGLATLHERACAHMLPTRRSASVPVTRAAVLQVFSVSENFRIQLELH